MNNEDKEFKKEVTFNNQTATRKDYWKSLLISSLFGFFFGLIFLVVSIIKGEQAGIGVYSLPLFCGIISGLAGIVGTFLEQWLKNRGIKNRLGRNMISLVVVMVMALVITGTVFWRRNFFGLFDYQQNKMVWGIFLGFLFGLIITLAEYYNWRMKQKMLILELENKYLEELAEKDLILKEATKNLLISRERNRMARELHDSISQGIHGIAFSIGSLKQELNKVDLKESKIPVIVKHLEQTAEATLQELRALISELKPALLEKNNLKRALISYCELFAGRQQIKVEIEIDELQGLSPDQELALYRIVQEALANVQKHSNADRVSISLGKTANSSEKNTITLVVRDNGQGFDFAKVDKGNGLNNMEVRGRQAGGTFCISTSPGKGTEVKVSFPG